MNDYRLGWFSTGRDKAARELLMVVRDNIRRDELKAEIAFVFCNREPGESKESDLFLKLVESYGLSLDYLSSKKFLPPEGIKPSSDPASDPWRLKYDREVMKRIERFHPDLCVLAGHMLIVGKEMCQRHSMVNLHPAAPGGPQGTWQEVIWQLIEKRDTETGVMMHLVIPELDKGPPATYCTFFIRGEPFDRYWQEIEGKPLEEVKRQEGENNALFKEIRKHGLVREFPLIIATLKAFSERRVQIDLEREQVVDAQGQPISGYNLSLGIDDLVEDNLMKGVR